MSPVSVSSVVQRVARRLHRSVLLAASLWAAAAFSTVLVVAWLWAGPSGWAQGTWGPLLLDSVLLAGLLASWPLLVGIRRRWLAEPRVARCVEDAAGLRPGTVVGSLELAREVPRGVSGGLARFAEQRLLGHLNHPDDHLAAPMLRRVGTWTRGGGASLALFAPALVLLAVLSPERTLSAWSGLSSPVFLLSPPAVAPIVVEPGDLEVRRGEGAEVTVEAPGREAVTLHWQAAGDVLSSRSLPLDGSAKGSHHFDAIDVPVRYWATTADGAESEVFELTPVDPLFVSDLRLVLEFPAHTAKPPEEYRGDVPPLSFPVGTRIKVDGRASRSLKDGSLTLKEGGEATTLTVEGPTFSAVWAPRKSGVYEWRFNDERGSPAELLPQPIEVTLTGDAAPEVRFTFPAVDTLMPITMRQPLVLEVQDDYGVVAVDLVAYRVSSDGESGEPVTQRIDVGVPRALANPVLDMSDWGLLPGDEVRYLARVTDNSPAGQAAETKEWVLRMPEAAEMRRGAQETLDLATKELEELTAEAARAAEEMRNLERQAAADRTGQGGRGQAGSEPNAGFEQREDVRAALERQQGMSSKLDSLRAELNQMSQAMRDAGVSDPGLRQDLQDLQKALSEMSSPELEQRLQQMQQELGSMDAREAQEMMRELSQQQEQLRQAMEQAVEQFRRAAVEQDFRATTSEAEELARRERALEEAMREGGNQQLRAQQQAEVQRQTEEVQRNMQSLEQRLQQLGEEQAAKGVQEGRQQAEAAREAMNQAQQQARQGQSQQAAQQAQQAAAKMEQAASDMREAGREMADDRSEAMRQALEGAAQDALGLARRQAEIREQMRDADASQMQQLRGDMGAVLQGLKSMTESMANAMQQSGGGQPEVSDRAQQATEALERTIESMSQRSSANPAPQASAENAVDALNRLAMSALAGARQAGQQGQGQQGGEQQGDLSQQMESAAQQQGQLNNQSGQIAPMQLGEQAMQRQLQDLARQQREIAGELSDMAASPDSEKMLGDLKALEQEARQIAESLAGGRLDPETRRRQERLFHRLLDAGRTLEQEDELSEQREARTAGSVEARDVQPLSAEAVGAIRFRLPDAEILQQMGPAQRQLVIQYFERLNREAPPAGAGTPAPAPAPASTPPPGGPRE